MNRWERENAFQLGIEFEEAGFQISQICCSRPSCFDFAARKAPFDFVLNVPDEEYVIIGGVASTNEMDLNARTEEILSVSRVVNAHPVRSHHREEATSLQGSFLCLRGRVVHDALSRGPCWLHLAKSFLHGAHCVFHFSCGFVGFANPIRVLVVFS